MVAALPDVERAAVRLDAEHEVAAAELMVIQLAADREAGGRRVGGERRADDLRDVARRDDSATAATVTAVRAGIACA